MSAAAHHSSGRSNLNSLASAIHQGPHGHPVTERCPTYIDAGRPASDRLYWSARPFSVAATEHRLLAGCLTPAPKGHKSPQVRHLEPNGLQDRTSGASAGSGKMPMKPSLLCVLFSSDSKVQVLGILDHECCNAQQIALRIEELPPEDPFEMGAEVCKNLPASTALFDEIMPSASVSSCPRGAPTVRLAPQP